MNLTRVAIGAAKLADHLIAAPTGIAKRVIDHQYDRRRRRAEADPRWVEIQTRRTTESGSGSILLSSERGLGWAEWEAQRRIERELTPDPWWYETVRKISRWHPRAVSGRMENALERTRRGWSTNDSYNAGHYIAAVTSGLLREMSQTASTWPKSEEFPTYKDWVEALETHAERLEHYVGGKSVDEKVSQWYEAAVESDPKAKELLSGIVETEFEVLEEAKASMRWVADHLGALWD